MRRLFLLALALGLPLAGVAGRTMMAQQTPQPAAASRPAETTVGPQAPRPVPHYSQAQLDRLRQSLVAQIAARDAAEGVMRAPTAEEAAALALPEGSGAGRMVQLRQGGVARHSDLSDASLLVATVGADGAVTVRHVNEAPAGEAKGGRDAR